MRFVHRMSDYARSKLPYTYMSVDRESKRLLRSLQYNVTCMYSQNNTCFIILLRINLVYKCI